MSFEEQNLTIDLPSTFTTGSQELLASQSPFLSVSNSIDSINSVGQSLLPSNPAGEVWRPTSIRLRIRRENSGSSVNIELYPAIDDGTPASNRLLLNSAPFAGSSIPSSYSDGYLVFNPSDVPWTKSSNRFAVTAEIAAGASSVSYARSGLGTDMLYEAGAGIDRHTSVWITNYMANAQLKWQDQCDYAGLYETANAGEDERAKCESLRLLQLTELSGETQ